MAPGVYLASPTPGNDEQYLWAAALYGGAQALLSGQAALVAHGWTGERRSKIDVLTHANANKRGAPKWIHIRRTTYPARAAKGGVPRARVPRATVDAAAWAASDEEAEFIVISVLQQRLATPRDIRQELDDLPVINRRDTMLTTIDEFENGIESMNEYRFARLCREYGIREPDRQVWRRDGQRRKRRLDVYWEAEGIVVEIDGIGHLDLTVRMDDNYRQNDFVLSGYRAFLRVDTVTLRHKPKSFMKQLLEAHEQARAKAVS